MPSESPNWKGPSQYLCSDFCCQDLRMNQGLNPQLRTSLCVGEDLFSLR
jgi:hypothetical protein